MISPDYPIECLAFLLNEDCLIERFHSLIKYREVLITGLKSFGCVTKRDVTRVSDEELAGLMRHDEVKAKLFRRFLTLYDPKSEKFMEIAERTSDPAEQEAFTELYHLPGVRFARASLYYQSGYKTLADISGATADDILSKTAMTISTRHLAYSVPFPKEVRTHIAVARAFTR